MYTCMYIYIYIYIYILYVQGRVVWCPGPAFYVDRIKLQRHTQRYSVMRSLSIDSTRLAIRGQVH